MTTEDGKFIFVIDDSADSRDLLDMYLTAKGFRVDSASNGEEALLKLAIVRRLPDYILLDAQMPTMDGYQFRTEQCKDDRLRNIPVVVMSGEDDTGLAARMLYPHRLLTKPVRLQSMLTCFSEAPSL